MIEFHGVHLDPRTLNAVYEQDEIDLAARLFRPDDRILLAGCGSGLLAATIAATVKPQALITVEPHRALAQLVRDNVRVHGAPLTVLDGALGTAPGHATYGGGDCWATSHIGAALGEQVEVIPMPDLIAEHRITALCLDVEGAEYDLLPTAPGGVTAALIELHHPPRAVPLPFATTLTPIRDGITLQWGRAR